VAVAIFAAAALVAVTALLLHRGPAHPTAAAASNVAASNATGSNAAGGTGPTSPTTAPAPLSVVSVTPASGAIGASLTAAVTVTFSAPLAATGAEPTITPAVAGTWARRGAALTFTPSIGYLPDNQYQVTVPAGTAAIEAGRTVSLAAPFVDTFTAGKGSFLRLQQLLAELHYLPLNFTPSSPADAEATTSAAVDVNPTAGTFSWAYPNTPASLEATWTQGVDTVMTTGAVMAFESAHGLAVDGVAGAQVWSALAAASAAHQVDSHPYDYLFVTETRPETLTVWQNGSDVYSTLANTGVAGATTATGTWPVYLRYQTTTMSGTNPNGTKYHDPNIPWVSYFNGSDAVHGFIRRSYGFPQSDGCVELPVANAQVVWSMDDYGTLVTVS
jgi:peptidoglycan hydrolase-like protein with peptidoglycan-binding domain